jgi:regulator of sirC expression with transglutaminase-like and TPR domain
MLGGNQDFMDRKESTWEQFVEVAGLPDQEVDLAKAALLIAATEYPKLDIDHELGVLDSLSAGASQRLGEERSPLFCMNTLSVYLFDEVGFRGNSDDYYDPRNSFLNDVLRRRVGIPITLSLIFVEVGKRLGVPLVGVGMPGHFLLKHRDEEHLFIDSFHRGVLLSEEECSQRLLEVTQASMPWDARLLRPVSNRDFISRMLRNLKGIYLHQEDHTRALKMIDRLIALQPQASLERRDRGLVHYQLGQYAQALDDLQIYLDSAASNVDTEAINGLVKRLRDLLGR